MTKRVVVISDLHSGSRSGLTPLGYFDTEDKWGIIRRQMRGEYTRMVKQHGPADVLLVLGDCIDGRGEASRSSELLTTNRLLQCEMASELIKMWKAPKIAMVVGTAYHTGKGEDFESVIKDSTGAQTIGDQEWVTVDNVVFDIKHHTSASEVPHSNGSLSREWVWNLVWGIRDEQPQANVFLRGHVHDFRYVGNDSYLAITCPSLQGNTKYGGRKKSRRIDFGIIYFDVEGDSFSWARDIVVVSAQKPQLIQF